jgi:hypothetical protein
MAHEHFLVQSAGGTWFLCLLRVEEGPIRLRFARHCDGNLVVAKPECLEIADRTFNGTCGIVAANVSIGCDLQCTYSLLIVEVVCLPDEHCRDTVFARLQQEDIVIINPDRLARSLVVRD